jgi:hypothetical protein
MGLCIEFWKEGENSEEIQKEQPAGKETPGSRDP